MLINKSSVFGNLQNTINDSMQLNIYLSERISLMGNFNNVQNNYQKGTEKSKDIVCDFFVCEEDGDNLICK